MGGHWAAVVILFVGILLWNVPRPSSQAHVGMAHYGNPFSELKSAIPYQSLQSFASAVARILVPTCVGPTICLKMMGAAAEAPRDPPPTHRAVFFFFQAADGVSEWLILP